MSRPGAVAAVTATLAGVIQRALDAGPGQGIVTTLPPGKAAKDGVNRVNLFLYEVTVDAALNNTTEFGNVRAGEPANPPLALGLHYLLTTFVGVEEPDLSIGDLLLGYAMAALHDHAVLGRAEIHAALNRPDNDLDQQPERVRVTWQPLSVDDLSRLWTTFQADYRTSVGFSVSPVLVDSAPPSTVPVPVLRRGPDDRGADIHSTPQPYPALESVQLAGAPDVVLAAGNSFASGGPLATPGDQLVLVGRNLANVGVVELTNTRSDTPLRLVPDAVQPTQLQVTVPATLPVSGVYTLAAVLSPDPAATAATAPTTNAVPVALAPAVSRPVAPVQLAGGTGTATVAFVPPLAPGQSARLLVGSRPFESTGTPAPGTLTFTVSGLAAGDYVARLRVAGLDSDSFPLRLS